MTASFNVSVTGYTGTTPPPDPAVDSMTYILIAGASIAVLFLALIFSRGKTQ